MPSIFVRSLDVLRRASDGRAVQSIELPAAAQTINNQTNERNVK